MPNGANPSGDISLFHEVTNEVAFMHAMKELVAINKHKMTSQTVSDFEDGYAEWEAAQVPVEPPPPAPDAPSQALPEAGAQSNEPGQGESQEEDEKPFIPDQGR
jgi:hypothetical protein